MSLCKRLIARLDIKGSRLIKGIRFEGLRVVGDPRIAALEYTEAGADELLYIDAVASLYGRNGLGELLRKTSAEVFIPITAGGGVRSVDDAAALLAAGADKIAINTAAIQRPELITELAEAFGSQCVVASIQARRSASGSWEAMTEAGRERSGRDVLSWIELVQQLGAGELIVTSVDQDGTCEGPDKELLNAAAHKANVPLTFGGGFGEKEQILEAWRNPRLSAVCLGAALHQKRLSPSRVKRLLTEETEHPIRESVTWGFLETKKQLLGKKIGIINYGMGNQQSLINALEYVGAETILSDEPSLLCECDLLALPGVGAFPQGMDELQSRGLDTWLKEWVKKGRPLLGICLGMQMLFETGEEFRQCNGLGIIKGKVKKLKCRDNSGQALILPHMGWNRLIPGQKKRDSLEQAIINSNQYFVHSYSATEVDPESVMFYSKYGMESFIAAVRMGNIVGFQFHPERSGTAGLALLSKTCLELMV